MTPKSLFNKRLHLPVPVEELRRLHYSAAAIPSLSPPIFKLEVRGDIKVEKGANQIIVTRLGPLKLMEWHAHIEEAGPDGFTDIAVKSPFSYFRHRHRFESVPGGCVLTDSIEFSPSYLRPILVGLFWYRHRRTRQLLTQGSS